MQIRTKRILMLGLPIIGGMTSQNVLNLVDTAMVGRLGDVALAASGLGGFVTFMSQAIILGLGVGVQAFTSRRIGAGQKQDAAEPLKVALLIAVLAGGFLTALLFLISKPLFSVFANDPAVLESGTEYFRWRIVSVIPVAANVSFRGFWNAIDKPSVYLRTLILMHILNVALNYGFIFGNFGLPAMGVSGAALASTLATIFGSLLYMLQAWYAARPYGFRHKGERRGLLHNVVKLAIPTGVEQLLFAAGFALFFAIVGRIGTQELAALSVLINILLLCFLPALGLGLAATTLIGQAMGRQEQDDAYAWGIDVAKLAAKVLFVIGVVLALFAKPILSLFIYNEATLVLAIPPLQMTGMFVWTEGIAMVLMQALLGTGATRDVVWANVVGQWLIFLPAAYLVGPVLGFGLFTVWVIMGLQRVGIAVFFVFRWRNKHWMHKLA